MSLKVETVSNYYNSFGIHGTRDESRIALFDYEVQKSDNKPNINKKAKAAAERKKAMSLPDDAPGRLKYYSERKSFIFKQKAYYEYLATGKENLYQIKNKFGIKPFGLENYNKYYKEGASDDCIPSKGTKVCFYAEDVE